MTPMYAPQQHLPKEAISINIYFDNAATTRVSKEVFAAMTPYLTEEYGNAGAVYQLGRRAAQAVQKAREQTAALFGCSAEHIIFTSGGSESNNTVFAGLRDRLAADGKKHLVVSAIEHDSVLKAAQALTKHGFTITYLYPESGGAIHPKRVEDAIQENTGLCSVMCANNETGVPNNIREIGEICKAHSVLFHTDCVQAAGQYPLSMDDGHVDFASVSSHKIHGPKGVGALYAKEKSFLPIIYGGAGQEFGLRGGTENVAGIVGFGQACEDVVKNFQCDIEKVLRIKQRFYTALLRNLSASGCDEAILHVNGLLPNAYGKVLNLRIDGVDGETLLLMLDANGICASAGSACRSHESKPSHVLSAMGLTAEEARSSVRVSFSKYNTLDEADRAAEVFAACIASLRGIGTK